MDRPRRHRRRTTALVILVTGLLVGAPTAAMAWASAAESAVIPLAAPEPLAPSEEPTPTPTPAPVTTDDPTPSPIPSPSPTATSDVVPEPTETAQPTPSATATPEPSPTTTPLPAVPPAVTTSTIDLPTLLIALGVLVAGGVLVWVLARRTPPDPEAPGTEAATAAGAGEPAPLVLDSMAKLGATMIDSGYPVGMVRDTLEGMAESSGLDSAHAVVFPTSILVSSGDGDTVQTRVVSAGDSPSLLYQVHAVDQVAGIARTHYGSAAWVNRHLTRIRVLPAPFTRLQRIGAYALLSAALSVLVGSSWSGVALAGVLGLGVGALLLASERLGAAARALVVVGAALAVSIAVLLVAQLFDPRVLPALVAPLIMLLPGGLLTIAVIELATGDIMSGAARAAAGAMRLLLLSAGIVAASALIGVPAIGGQVTSLGPIAPWVAVAVFGVGICVYQCARPASIGWIILVLYVAYGAQVVGDVFFDGVLSALIGAAAMTPVAVIVARQRSGPPALVSFLPAFWLLVPGALGLIGVASVLEGDSSGLTTIFTTIATMVSIALGVLIALAVIGAFGGLRGTRGEEWMRDELFADIDEPPRPR